MPDTLLPYAEEYLRLKQVEKEAGRDAKDLKAKVVAALGDAEVGRFPDGTEARQKLVRRGEYTVEQTVWIDGKTVADPERLADEVTGTSPETGTVGAQYRINSHHWDAFAMPVAVYYNPAERGNTPDAAAAIQAAIQKWNAVSPSSFSFAWAGVGDGLPGACNPEAEAVTDGKV